MSVLSYRIFPKSSFNTPEIRLNTVDFPEPLGPIKAVIEFSLILKLHLSTAFTPPKCFDKFLIFSILF